MKLAKDRENTQVHAGLWWYQEVDDERPVLVEVVYAKPDYQHDEGLFIVVPLKGPPRARLRSECEGRFQALKSYNLEATVR